MGRHTIQHDASGVQIRYRGFPPAPLVGSLVAIIVLLFAGIYLALMLQRVVPALPDGWFLRLDMLWRVAVGLLCLTGPMLLMVAVAYWLCLGHITYWKLIEFDRAKNRFFATEARLLLGKRSYECSLGDIWRMEAEAGAEGSRPIQVHLGILCGQEDPLVLHLAIEDVNRRDEALDVLLTIARVTGLNFYSVGSVDVQSMAVSLVREASEDVLTPIPEATQSPRYDLDRVSTSLAAPTPTVASFDWQSFDHPEMRIKTWEPGNRIQIERGGASLTAMLIVGSGLAACAWFLSRAGWQFPSVAFVAGAFGYRLFNHAYEFAIDWKTELVTWRREWWTRTVGLHELKSLALRGVEERVHRHRGRNYLTYRCQIEMHFRDGRRIKVIDNGSWSKSDSKPRRELEPLVAALAEAVNRPWRWISYDEPSFQRSLDSAVTVTVLLGVIGLLGLFAYAMWWQSRASARHAAVVRQIEATGASVRRTGIDVGKENIFGDGYFVTVDKPAFSDGDLKSLLPLLDELPLYGLDVSGTSISDEAIALFVGRPSMFLLLARNTRLTSAAAGTLAKTNIQCLDVRDTAMTLDDVQAWTHYHALDVLYISDPQVTDKDRKWLDLVPQLDYVLVNDEATTKPILAELNKDLSPPAAMTEFEKLQFLDAFALKLAPAPRFSRAGE